MLNDVVPLLRGGKGGTDLGDQGSILSHDLDCQLVVLDVGGEEAECVRVGGEEAWGKLVLRSAQEGVHASQQAAEGTGQPVRPFRASSLDCLVDLDPDVVENRQKHLAEDLSPELLAEVRMVLFQRGLERR